MRLADRQCNGRERSWCALQQRRTFSFKTGSAIVIKRDNKTKDNSCGEADSGRGVRTDRLTDASTVPGPDANNTAHGTGEGGERRHKHRCATERTNASEREHGERRSP